GDTVVEAESGRIHRPRAAGQHAAPGDTEAVRLHSEPRHQSHIVAVAAVVVAGDITRIAVAHQAGGMREALPDAGCSAVGERGALDLVRRGRAAPQEIRWKGDRKRTRLNS